MHGRKEHALEACQNRSREISLKLKRIEPNSPYALNIDKFRSGIYRNTMRKMKLNWIHHKLTPPLLLTLDIEKTLDEENKRKE